MNFLNALRRRSLWAGLLLVMGTLAAQAAEIRVITSGAFTESYKKLVPVFEAASGHKVISSFGASIGKAPDSIPSRFERGGDPVGRYAVGATHVAVTDGSFDGVAVPTTGEPTDSFAVAVDGLSAEQDHSGVDREAGEHLAYASAPL